MTMQTTLSLDTLEAIRSRLVCESERLQEQIRELRSAEGLDQPQDLARRCDEVNDQAEQTTDQAKWDRMHMEDLSLTDRLSEVEHALTTFEWGSCGLCEACGAPIPRATLLAEPTAQFDLEHGAALEVNSHPYDSVTSSR